MTYAESLIIPMFARVRFQPGTSAKRFARSMMEQSAKPDFTLSAKQRAVLWKIAHHFRKQIESKCGWWTRIMIAIHHNALWEGAKIKDPEERAFQLALSLDPADWVARLIFADWLEEHGQYTLANGQRWMSEQKQHPMLEASVWEGVEMHSPPVSWKWISPSVMFRCHFSRIGCETYLAHKLEAS